MQKVKKHKKKSPKFDREQQLLVECEIHERLKEDAISEIRREEAWFQKTLNNIETRKREQLLKRRKNAIRNCIIHLATTITLCLVIYKQDLKEHKTILENQKAI